MGDSGSKSSDGSAAASSSASSPISVPPALANVLQKLGPVLIALGNVLNAVEPYVERAIDGVSKGYELIKPYHPDEFVPALFGLFTAFFGGHYLLTIAAVEAYRMTGWDRTQKYLMLIWEDYCIVRDESRRDDCVDADADGIADVKQITHKQL